LESQSFFLLAEPRCLKHIPRRLTVQTGNPPPVELYFLSGGAEFR
jgi:hypothetical protein